MHNLGKPSEMVFLGNGIWLILSEHVLVAFVLLPQTPGMGPQLVPTRITDPLFGGK
jgi:hypothetical protein